MIGGLAAPDCFTVRNTDLSNRFASRVADCNFLTEGKSETVVMAIWDNNTLNTPYKQGVSGFGNGFVIGMSLELAWAIQVAFAVSDTSLFVRVILLLESVGPVGELYN